MSQDFDQFPIYDVLVKSGTFMMSPQWVDFISTFYQTLVSYLSSNGIFLPPLTTVQRDQIVNPQKGQMIYNTTLDTAQYFKAGAWASF